MSQVTGTSFGLSDERPLQREQTDRPSAFDALVADHEPMVRRLAWRLLGWRGDVDDVVQDVFLIALKKLHTFRADAKVSTWLATITLNRCRSQRRRELLQLNWLRRQWHVSDAEVSNAAQPEKDEVAQRVREAVQSLRPRDREVIVLFYLEQLPVKEMSTLLGVSENAIDVRLHRARQRLKDRLNDLGQDF